MSITVAEKTKAGTMAGLANHIAASDQAFLVECETHQPLALTDLPGNSWHGP